MASVSSVTSYRNTISWYMPCIGLSFEGNLSLWENDMYA